VNRVSVFSLPRGIFVFDHSSSLLSTDACFGLWRDQDYQRRACAAQRNGEWAVLTALLGWLLLS
jgi:multisubunit Na+/H+ antiporter MnhG subunit